MNMKLNTLFAAIAVAMAVNLVSVKAVEAKLVAETTDTKAAKQMDAAVPADDTALAVVNSEPEQSTKPSTVKINEIRRQRARQEIKNEDLLAQKIEEVRLREEMKRADAINSDNAVSSGLAEEPKALHTETSLAMANPSATPQSTTTAAPQAEEDLLMGRMSITPRGGLSTITGSIYDVRSKYALGADVEVSLSDYFSIVGGYTYAKYDVTATPSMFSTPYAYLYQPMGMNDNIFNIGARGYLLGMKQRVRPFVGAGAGYRMGYVNYDTSTVSLQQAIGTDTQDVSLTALSGYLEGGVDFQVSHTLSITADFRYFNIFNSRQSAPINPYGFVNYGGGAFPAPLGYNTDIKSQVGNSLASSNFYQLMGGVTVNF